MWGTKIGESPRSGERMAVRCIAVGDGSSGAIAVIRRTELIVIDAVAAAVHAMSAAPPGPLHRVAHLDRQRWWVELEAAVWADGHLVHDRLWRGRGRHHDWAISERVVYGDQD